MKVVEDIQNEIQALPHRQYMQLLRWFSEHDWKVWDNEIEKDSNSGKLDFLIEEANEEKRKGKLRDF